MVNGGGVGGTAEEEVMVVVVVSGWGLRLVHAEAGHGCG
jgi:hypothetical protein